MELQVSYGVVKNIISYNKPSCTVGTAPPPPSAFNKTSNVSRLVHPKTGTTLTLSHRRIEQNVRTMIRHNDTLCKANSHKRISCTRIQISSAFHVSEPRSPICMVTREQKRTHFQDPYA